MCIMIVVLILSNYYRCTNGHTCTNRCCQCPGFVVITESHEIARLAEIPQVARVCHVCVVLVLPAWLDRSIDSECNGRWWCTLFNCVIQLFIL